MKSTRPASGSTGNPAVRGSRWSMGSLLLGAASVPGLLLWFAGLGGRALGEPDEGRYAEVAREMFASGNWLTPRLDGFNFFDKPALQYWATSVFYTVFGVHAWTARLWVALTGLLAIAAAGWASKRLHDARTGWITALLLGSTLLFMAGGHINTIDMGVAAFLSIAISLFLVAQFDPSAESLRTRLNLLGWASLALAVLSKGLIGLVLPAGTLLVFMLWQRDWSILRRLSLGWGLLLLLAIGAPWFVAISLRHPDFFDYFFIREHFSRFLTSVDGRNKPWWFFVAVVASGLFPWTAFLPLTLAGWREMLGKAAAERFLLSWIAVVLVFFSVSHSKLPFYILPLFPALAMLLARRISLLSPQALAWRFAWVALLSAAVVVAVIVLPLSSRQLSQPADMQTVRSHLAWGFAALAAIGVTGALWLGNRRQPMAPLGLLGLGALLVWQMLFANLGPLIGHLSAAPVAQMMRPWLTADTEVFTVRAYQRGLSFYLQRLVTVAVESPDDIEPFKQTRPAGYLPELATFETRWRAAPDAIAVVDSRLLPQLQADQLPLQIVGTLPEVVVIRRPDRVPGTTR
jgi:4-amino-4-deoxy-L-arabinose transferase-like glycosyltransferase